MINKLTNYKNLFFATFLGMLGLIINLYPLPFFANVQFVLGNTFTVIVAILCGPWYALLTSILASSGLMMIWESYHVYLFFGLEAIFIGFCRRRDIYALYSSVMFWLFIGMPLFYFVGNILFNLPADHLPFVTIKQAINSLIYTSIASLLILMIPKLWLFETKIKDKKRRTLSKQMTYFITLMITLTSLFSTLYFNYTSLITQQNLIKQNQNETVFHLSNSGDQYVNHHIKAIENAAQTFSLSDPNKQKQQHALNSLHQNYPGFITMLLTDNNSKVIAGSPLTKFQLTDDMKVNDRDYFIEAFYNQKVFISSVFLGRGFGNDAIIAISAPYFNSNNPMEPQGIIEGSLNLQHFTTIDYDFKPTNTQSIVLTDEKGSIIYASDRLNLEVMSPFDYSIHAGAYKTKLNLLNIHDTDSLIPEFIYASHKMNNGWIIYLVEPFLPLLKLAEKQMFTSFVLLLFALLLSFFISHKISKLLTVPLEMVANQFGQFSEKQISTQVLDENSPKEVYSLYNRLLKSKQQLIAHQLELEETVAIRTHELESANKKLKALVDKDPLTQLYNRRYAEQKFAEIRDYCKRSEQALTVAILDLDFFKQVNDTYGHLAGDECLRQVADLLRQFYKRDVDVVARYGGEEFILILPLSNALSIEQHLNQFRLALAQMTIVAPKTKKEFSLTTSIGAITANADFNKDIDHWIKVADDNLYQAKAQGRNQVRLTIINSDLSAE
ncbi:diguanylate cyclase [Shewanella gaetbuli]